MPDITEEELLALMREARELADAVADAREQMPRDHAQRLSRAADSTFVNLVQALDALRKSRRQPP
jgi:hypothetical protein